MGINDEHLPAATTNPSIPLQAAPAYIDYRSRVY